MKYFVTGINCEINIDDCKSNPCDYGTCIDKINGYECACEPGYTGEQRGHTEKLKFRHFLLLPEKGAEEWIVGRAQTLMR